MNKAADAARTRSASLLGAAFTALLVSSCSMAGMGSGGANGADPMSAAVLKRHASAGTVASTVPANGDLNPYGVAPVKRPVGKLREGGILVSNFNNSANLQGTGTTIVQVADGAASLFAQVTSDSLPNAFPDGIGLTTALVELSAGWVIVGSLPTADGTAATARPGCLIVLDATGKVVETISGPLINGPWDMTAWERDGEAKLFVTNVLNGTVAGSPNVVDEGTVVRVDLSLPKNGIPKVESMTVIGSGFSERTDPDALVIGPTGVGLGMSEPDGHERSAMSDPDDRGAVLYVADSLNDRIAMIPDALHRTTSAGTGSTLTSGGTLNDPLGLTVAPGGHVLTVNGNDGLLTEITPQGDQVAHVQLDDTGTPPGAGTLFGLAAVAGKGTFFVDDGSNTLSVLR